MPDRMSECLDLWGFQKQEVLYSCGDPFQMVKYLKSNSFSFGGVVCFSELLIYVN